MPIGANRFQGSMDASTHLGPRGSAHLGRMLKNMLRWKTHKSSGCFQLLLDIIRLHCPKAGILENVPLLGHANDYDSTSALDELVDALESMGYNVQHEQFCMSLFHKVRKNRIALVYEFVQSAL